MVQLSLPGIIITETINATGCRTLWVAHGAGIREASAGEELKNLAGRAVVDAPGTVLLSNFSG